MNTKILIEDNNQQRELLTPDNEAYYRDLLIYIRLQLTLSEQQSEEILIQLLDHLLDGQNEGKTANDIFGDDPKAFADEIIEQLPKEDKREVIPFIAGIACNIVSWVLIIRGILLLTLSQFTEVKTEINLFVTGVVSLGIACFISLTIWFILRLINNSLFIEKRNTKKNMLKAGVTGAAGMGAVLLLAKFTPEIGPSFHFPWWASLMGGAILWLLAYLKKK